MTDEEELGEEEQPTARPRLKYGEGLKRIWVVLSVCWVGFLAHLPRRGDRSRRTNVQRFDAGDDP